MGLRSIMYISKVAQIQSGANVPVNLAEIYQSARRKNEKHGITGVLSYAKGHYLQVIEGEEDSVNRLFDNISRDVRHNKIRIILNTDIDQRYFASRGMRLAGSLSSDASFKRFFASHSIEVSRISEPNKKRLACFYNARNFVRFSSFEGKSLRLSAWPDFSRVKQSLPVIELSARLTATSGHYEELVSDQVFGTKDQIDKTLNSFNDLGILVVSDYELGKTTSWQQGRSSQGFYVKMKRFLGLH